jgi:hypothetical protein
MSFVKTAEGILTTVGVLSLMLFAFYGLSHLISTHAPAPINTLVSNYVSKTTAAGWSNG